MSAERLSRTGESGTLPGSFGGTSLGVNAMLQQRAGGVGVNGRLIRSSKYTAIGAALVAALLSLLIGGASASIRRARAAATSPPATVTGILITRRPGTLARGSRVSARDVGDQRQFLGASHGFALANVGQADYPVETSDGGKTWRTSGPAVHLDAAQAPLAVTVAGAANLHTLFACCDAQVVDSTGDGGKHWWRAFLGDVVLAVRGRPGGELIAFAQSAANASGSRAATWVYVSRDGGHHWHYDAQEGAF